jgi:hypothetical protein
MKLEEIPDVRLQTKGVMFQYLIFKIVSAGKSKTIVRGVNYQLYYDNADEKLMKWVRKELEEDSLLDQGGGVKIEGGGTLTLNPYYETLTLFGSSQTYGEETNRADVAKMFEQSFPDHEVSWSPAEPEPKPSTPKNSKKAAAKSKESFKKVGKKVSTKSEESSEKVEEVEKNNLS